MKDWLTAESTLKIIGVIDEVRNVVRKKTGLCGKNSQRGGGV